MNNGENQSPKTFEERAKLAGERISAAKVSLCMSLPYMATPLLRLSLIPVNGNFCRTMGTDGCRIYYCPDFVSGLSGFELQGVLIHELMHVLLQHPAREKDRKHRMWNRACDYAVNGILFKMGISLPRGVLFERYFSDMTAEEIYEHLKDGSAVGGDMWSAYARAAAEKLGRITLPAVKLKDLIRRDDKFLPEIFRNASDEDLENEARFIASIRKSWAEDMKRQGYISANLEKRLNKCGSGAVNWQRLLQQWLTDRLKNDWSLYPPSKRHIWRGLYMPSVGAPAPGHIYMAVDTSGSVSDQTLGKIFSEIDSFREMFPCRLTVLQADAGVNSVKEYEAYDCSAAAEDTVKVCGRGGTDFRPAFQWIENAADEGAEAGAVIYLTDGYGTFPAESRFPVLWMVTDDGLQDEYFPDFGTVVRLPF